MIQETIAPKEIDAVKTLVSFATQRPGLSFEDYGSGYWYRKDQREVVKDLHDFWELMGLAGTYVENLNDKLRITLMNSSGRLTMNEQGVIQYCTGQYFPTEYRPAACQILSRLIWTRFCDRYPDYTGTEIRKAIKKITSLRVYKNYFN